MGKYWKGRYTKAQRAEQITYVVETIEGKEFKYLGQVTITMGQVYDRMDATKNIKDNMPSTVAKEYAHAKFPKANPIIVTELWIWKDKYGEPRKRIGVMTSETETMIYTELVVKKGYELSDVKVTNCSYCQQRNLCQIFTKGKVEVAVCEECSG